MRRDKSSLCNIHANEDKSLRIKPQHVFGIADLYGRLVERLEFFWPFQNRHMSCTVNMGAENQENKQQIISEIDLQKLLDALDEKIDEDEIWKPVIEKRNDRVFYTTKCCNPKDGGPPKYISTTIFENCSTELLKNFIMDLDFRIEWDKTILKHEKLQFCKETGTETGRIIKKFPLLAPREYVVAWRIWEEKNNTFYCFIKACEHPQVPRQHKYKRVEFYISGWRIRKGGCGDASRDSKTRLLTKYMELHMQDGGQFAKICAKKGLVSVKGTAVPLNWGRNWSYQY
eukprot:Gb_27417 [translate_table: standard]